ncbi:MAG TPA: hypothetical protein VN962_04230, partial [Polyangia bacterium]|nr:hypothetical protein [Polyangia bacterium]
MNAVNRFGMVGLFATAAGCGASKPATPPSEVRPAPVQPEPVQAAPLPQMVAAVEEAPAALLAAAPAGSVIDARVLVISADGSDSELAAIQQTLGDLGTPFDVLIAAQTTLTAAQLASGTHGRYNAIFLTRGNLVLSDGTSAFSSAEFQTLANYEATFQVRRVSLYTSPDASYGYSSSVSQDTSSSPLATQCTSAGQAAFSYVNCANGVTISGAFAYPAAALDAATVPLLVDANGRILAARRSYSDGREALSLNFAQSGSLFHALQLLPSVVSWATRGVFLGDRHVYVGVQIDDLFLADALYAGGTLRISASDLQAALDYQNAKRAQTITAGFKFNMAFNGSGASSSDALTVKAQQIGSGFNWIDHTWDHPFLDTLSYSQVLSELTQNTAAASQYGLKPY